MSARDVTAALAAGDETDADGLTEPASAVMSDDPVGDALKQLDHGADAVAVIDSDKALVGWIRHRDMLAAMTAIPVAAPPS